VLAPVVGVSDVSVLIVLHTASGTLSSHSRTYLLCKATLAVQREVNFSLTLASFFIFCVRVFEQCSAYRLQCVRAGSDGFSSNNSPQTLGWMQALV
jgi:hypothetical protein